MFCNYPGGMIMPGRKYFSVSSYRYGFNGKELEKDIASDNYDFGARIYDGRIVRWLSLDLVGSRHPDESTYIYCGNSPLVFSDPDGNDRIVSIYAKYNGKTYFIGKAVDNSKYVWARSAANKNVYHKYNTHEVLTIDLNNSSFIKSKGKISGLQDGIPYAEFEVFFEDMNILGTSDQSKRVNESKGNFGEGTNLSRGGWTLISGDPNNRGFFSDKVLKGLPSGSIDVDMISLAISAFVTSPKNFEESLLSFSGVFNDILGKKDEKGQPYLPKSVIDYLNSLGGTGSEDKENYFDNRSQQGKTDAHNGTPETQFFKKGRKYHDKRLNMNFIRDTDTTGHPYDGTVKDTLHNDTKK